MKKLTIGLLITGLAIGGVWLYAKPQAPLQTRSSPISDPEAALASSTLPGHSAPLLAVAHTVGTVAATPLLITVGTPTQVTFAIQITDQALIATSVNLLSLGATGTQPSILGVMQNTGNGVYMLQQSFNESVAGQVQFQVSAAFKGALQRVLSNVLTLSVGTAVTDATSGLTFTLPPLGTAPLVTNLGATSGADFVISVVALDPSDDLMHPLLRIFALPNPLLESLQTWFESNVDDASSTLLASGAFQEQQLSNGPALVLVGAIPATYQGGPVAQAYMVLPGSPDRVDAIIQSQDGTLTDFGFAASSVPAILTSDSRECALIQLALIHGRDLHESLLFMSDANPYLGAFVAFWCDNGVEPERPSLWSAADILHKPWAINPSVFKRSFPMVYKRLRPQSCAATLRVLWTAIPVHRVHKTVLLSGPGRHKRSQLDRRCHRLFRVCEYQFASGRCQQ